MALSPRAKKLVAEITKGNLKLGDLKKRGAEIKKDHDLAVELWSTGEYYPRLLATLIFDKRLLAENVIDQLASDMLRHDAEERTQLADWLFFSHDAIRETSFLSLASWVGQAPPGNSADLLDSLENDMAQAEPEVQWAMNFCAGQIGVHEPRFRSRCIKLGVAL